ncbi:MAG: hypothetical protein ACSHX0_05115 [Akkermansiaceae bacterium]
MAKNKSVNEPKKKSKVGGCLKSLVFLTIFGAIVYAGFHIYFLAQASDEAGVIGGPVMKAEVMGTKIFPALETFPLDEINGREEILKGWLVKTPTLPARLQNAIDEDYPVTFREDELNAWLSKRVKIHQGGVLAPYVKDSFLWVDLREGEIELILERELNHDKIHFTSVIMKFGNLDGGFSMQPYAARVGQVKAPGGFARLIIPSFEQILDELADDLAPFKNGKIRDVKVEEGKITFDPRVVANP